MYFKGRRLLYFLILLSFISYIQQIRDLLNNGAPVSGIGVQGHLGPDAIDLNKVEDSLDKIWEEFGLPIWITEFDWSNSSSNEDNHAQHSTEL